MCFYCYPIYFDLEQESKNLARLFHEYYEALAPEFGYETKEETQIFDENSPNGKLMIAVCKKMIEKHVAIKRRG